MELSVLKTVLISIFLFVSSASAERWNVDTGGIFSKGTGAVISGYDVVSYFTESKAVKGNPNFLHSYEGGTFHFSSAANLEKFKSAPEQYLPEYGGFCAYAAASNSLVDVDPESFTVIDGRLFLNYNKRIKAKFDKDTSGYISDADKFWPSLKM